jgi:hypothetical protein
MQPQLRCSMFTSNRAGFGTFSGAGEQCHHLCQLLGHGCSLSRRDGSPRLIPSRMPERRKTMRSDADASIQR